MSLMLMLMLVLMLMHCLSVLLGWQMDELSPLLLRVPVLLLH